jgi:esterase
MGRSPDAVTAAAAYVRGMPDMHVNGIRLYYEERGEGVPILCIHGGLSSALMWASAAEELAPLGRVISYDRRGCARSERPQPYERTSVAEQADDAAALLDALHATPAIVIGRSYGGDVAIDLALRHPDRVRALALLEGGAGTVSPEWVAWARGVVERLHDTAATEGVDAVARVLIGDVLGESAWESFPEQVRRMFTDNAPAILVEANAEWLDRAPALADIDQPTLLVAAADSREPFGDVMDRMQAAMPDARTAVVEGGHLIDPAHPAVISFVEEQTALAARCQDGVAGSAPSHVTTAAPPARRRGTEARRRGTPSGRRAVRSPPPDRPPGSRPRRR